jgi:hypothetical protein
MHRTHLDHLASLARWRMAEIDREIGQRRLEAVARTAPRTTPRAPTNPALAVSPAVPPARVCPPAVGPASARPATR